jgi:hypothetical protein
MCCVDRHGKNGRANGCRAKSKAYGAPRPTPTAILTAAAIV